MSTFISLVVVGVCVVATTWLVLRDGGKPATETSPDHREPPPPAPSPPTVATAAPAAEPVAARAAVVEAPRPPSSPPSEPPPPDQRRRSTRGRIRRRRARAAAPERVRARRRDHPRLGRGEAPEQVLVPPAELPAAQPEAVRPVERVRSGAGVLALVVFIGLSAAVVLGLLVVVISDILEDAVR